MPRVINGSVEILLSVIAFLILGCGPNETGKSRKVIPESVLQRRLPGSSFHEFSNLSKVVKLEHHPDALIGWIDHVRVDRQGRLFTLDRRSTKRVYCFNSEGNFLRTVGFKGKGPGEYERPNDFVVLNNDSVVILADSKLLKYNSKLEHEKSLDLIHPTGQLALTGDHIVVTKLWERKGEPKLFMAFDYDLQKVGEFGQREPEYSRMRLAPRRHADGTNQALFSAFFYRPEILRFDQQFNLQNRYVFPERQPDIREKFNQGISNEKDVTFFIQNLDTTYRIWASDRFVFIVINQPDLGTRQSSIFFPDKKINFLFDPPEIFSHDETVMFDHITGISGDTMIQVVYEDRTFRRLEKYYPELSGVTMEPDDNPILLFLDLSGWQPE